MKQLDQKYIELILERCLNIRDTKYLFINYDVINQEFVNKIVEYTKDLDIEVYLDKEDIFEKKDILSNIEKDKIKEHPLFDCSIWNEYAEKKAAFLMISTETPKVLDDVDISLIAESSKVKMNSKSVYKKMQRNNELAWLIAVYPNKIWAKDMFPELDEKEAYDKLYNLIMEVTMCTEENPIEKWNEQLDRQAKMMKKLNSLKIKELHYTNELGTDLYIGLHDNALWQSAGCDNNKYILNMPSYEVFTSPDFHKTNGIVYSTKPLVYNSSLIEEFWIKFKDGVVEDFDAKTGKDLLKEIIEGDEGAARLGEVALVDKNSPIAKTNVVFGETCLDENASCHIALGSSFNECFEGASDLNDEEKEKVGLNSSKNHVDFMIGSEDLNIEAETAEGKVQIFVNGEFNI